MIKCFDWGKKGGCIIGTDRNEVYAVLNDKFADNIKSTKEHKTVAGWFDVFFKFKNKVEPSEFTKKILKLFKE